MATWIDHTYHMDSPQPVFVLGTGRCGSTLAHEVLTRHTDVGFVSNVEDRLPGVRLTGRWNASIYRRLPVAFTQKGRLRFAPSEGYRVLDRHVSPMLSAPSRDLVAADLTPWLRDELRAFFHDRMSAQQQPVFIHKFTGWPRIGLLHATFEEAPFINIVRDGRAVVNSWLQMPWWTGFHGPCRWSWGELDAAERATFDESGQSFAVLAALAWSRLMRAYDKASAALPPSKYLEIRYEDLLAQPEGAFARMVEFCGLQWTEQFDKAFRRYQFSTSRANAFEADLPTAVVEQITGVMKSELAAKGYL